LDATTETATQKPRIDREAFADLFFAPQKNRDQIWKQMAEIVRAVASQVLVSRCMADQNEIKGDALAFAMEVAVRRPFTKVKGGRYDPTKRTALNFFYTVIMRFMVHRLRELDRRPEQLDEEIGISFDDVRHVTPRDMAHRARSFKAEMWISYRLQCEQDRRIATLYLKSCLERARREARRAAAENCSTEVAVAKVYEQALIQVRRALLG
jgi:hypothetical protein